MSRCRTSFHNLIGGWDARTRREWVHYEWSGGGNGAFREGDGPSAMATIDWGDLVTVQPSEVLETRFPLLVEESRLRTDSGGAGATRGGLAMQRRLRLPRHELGLEPEHPPAETRELAVPARIGRSPPRVAASIDFDDQPCGGHREVRDESPDDHLAPDRDTELRAAEQP